MNNNNIPSWTNFFASTLKEGENDLPIWDEQHTKLIFSCLDRKILNEYTIHSLSNDTGVVELIKSIQFLYGVYYDRVLSKRINNNTDSTDSLCVYSENEQFYESYQSKLQVKKYEVYNFIDLCYFESIFKHVDENVFYYKMFERLFALDLDNDWSATFPSITKSSPLLKEDHVMIRKMFEIELEELLKMIQHLLSWGFKYDNLDFYQSFALYCKNNYSNVAELANSILNQINRLNENTLLNPLLNTIDFSNTTGVNMIELFKDNNLIEQFNEFPQELLNYRTLYANTYALLQFNRKRITIQDILNVTEDRQCINKMCSLLDKFGNYLTFHIVNQKDITKRVNLLETIQKAFIYAIELKDFESAKFFYFYVMSHESIVRLNNTRKLIDEKSGNDNLKTLLEKSKTQCEAPYNALNGIIEEYNQTTIPIWSQITSITFIREGNTNQNVILLLSYGTVELFGRLSNHSILGRMENELIEDGIIEILDESNKREFKEIQYDKKILELLLCVATKFQQEEELLALSLECEQ